MPVLQLALDVIQLSRAIEIAREAIAGGVDWIEVGTPLIKSEGMNAVREIRRAFPGRKIVADLKTMDVGGLEVEMAAKSGANVCVIMGLSSDATILDALRAAENFGVEIMVDLLNHPEPVKRAIEVQRMGAHYICVHVSVDSQMLGENPLTVLQKVSSAVNIPIAVAGGINEESASDMVKYGAEIIIVGGAITKSPNCAESARRIKEAIEKGIKFEISRYKKYTEANIIEALKKVSTPNISDAMHRKGSLKGIRYICGQKIVGRAVTVKTVDGDWAKPVEAIGVAERGSVIVIDAGGGYRAVWGELASLSCKVKGIEGVVINGAARDIDAIKEMNFSLYCRNISPEAGEPKGYGEINVDIEIEGVKIRPGDWIVGDENGVVVIPKEIAVEIANRALDVMEKEERIRKEISEGKILSDILELYKWEVEK